jgi:hypothetical protein
MEYVYKQSYHAMEINPPLKMNSILDYICEFHTLSYRTIRTTFHPLGLLSSSGLRKNSSTRTTTCFGNNMEAAKFSI